jgi:glutathione synthase
MLRKLKSKIREEAKPETSRTPTFVNERLIRPLANTIFDWQLVNGMLLKYRDGDSIKAKPFSVSLVPTPFPKHLFERAQSLQRAYNELYAKVSSDEEWLLNVLEEAGKRDVFVRTLIEIHKKVKEEGFAQASM